MDQQERDGETSGDSPVSANEEDISDAEPPSGTEPDENDGYEEMRRQHALLADHNDVLDKLKRQVRDINVRVSNGSFPYAQDDFDTQRTSLSFPINNRAQDTSMQFPVPFPFPHPAGTPFLPPMAPPPQPHSSGSSHSSEGSGSSQHTWSFEEQFKQVRQLYEISDDPRRKEFLDELFSFMQKRGTPINRLPIMAKSVLDLFELYNLVIARGGLVDVINKKLWQEIIKGLHLPSSITSAAFTLRTQYMKYLYPYECEKRNLSTPAELQAAIDGNRREGRRGGYAPPYDVANAHQLNQLALSQHQQLAAARYSTAVNGGINGMSPNATHTITSAMQNARALMPNIPPLGNGDIESTVMQYMRYINRTLPNAMELPPHSLDLQLPQNGASALSPMEIQRRMNLVSIYNNNHVPEEPQSEPMNLSEPSTSASSSTKRETDSCEPLPPPKRVSKEEDDREEEGQQQEEEQGEEIDYEEEQAREPVPSASASSPPLVHNTSSTTTIQTASTQITINSRGDTKNGRDKSLVVSMELNGITYTGVLFAQNLPEPPACSASVS